MSLPLYSGSFEEYHGWGDLRAELAALGCDGMEGIDRKSTRLNSSHRT